MDPRLKWALSQAFDKLNKLGMINFKMQVKWLLNDDLDWLDRLADSTRWKVDDKIVNAIGIILNTLAPFKDKLTAKAQARIDKLQAKIDSRYAELPKVKEEAKYYKAVRRKQLGMYRRGKEIEREYTARLIKDKKLPPMMGSINEAKEQVQALRNNKTEQKGNYGKEESQELP